MTASIFLSLAKWPSFLWFRSLLTVTKKDIVKTISDEIGLTQLKTKEIVQKTFDAIVRTLVQIIASSCETSVFSK